MSDYHLITDYNTIDLKCIKVQKPYCLDNKLHFDINYVNTFRGPLYIQSPLGILPYKYNLYDDKYFQIDVQISCEKFQKFIKSISDVIFNKIKKWCKISCHINTTTFRFYNYNSDLINIFDSNANISSLNRIVKHDKVYLLFHFEKVVYNKENDKISVALKLLQIKTMTTPLFKCMIRTEESSKKPPPPPGPPPPPPPPQPVFKLFASKALPDVIKRQVEIYKPPSLKEILEAKSKLKKSLQINYDI